MSNKIGNLTRFSDRGTGTADVFVQESASAPHDRTYFEIRCNEAQIGQYNCFAAYVDRAILENIKSQIEKRLKVLDAPKPKRIWLYSTFAGGGAWYGPYDQVTSPNPVEHPYRAVSTRHSTDGQADGLTGPITRIHIGENPPSE